MKHMHLCWKFKTDKAKDTRSQLGGKITLELCPWKPSRIKTLEIWEKTVLGRRNRVTWGTEISKSKVYLRNRVLSVECAWRTFGEDVEKVHFRKDLKARLHSLESTLQALGNHWILLSREKLWRIYFICKDYINLKASSNFNFKISKTWWSLFHWGPDWSLIFCTAIY